ncbi:MAG: hypothetical protein WB392_06215 [Methanotrichaceae archaeon]
MRITHSMATDIVIARFIMILANGATGAPQDQRIPPQKNAKRIQTASGWMGSASAPCPTLMSWRQEADRYANRN